MIFPSKHISISIHCPADRVYDFALNPENLPQWASGLGGSIQKDGNDWIADSPMGKIKIAFAERNAFGVLDHDVALESGTTFSNPMRVVQNGDGSEITFTLFRLPDMSDEAFEKDAATIEHDL